MGLTQVNFEGKTKIEVAIDRLQHYEPEEGYYLADSFGKDSDVVRDLVLRSGVKYDGHFNLSGVDPPELIRFGRENHPEVEIIRPAKSIYKQVVARGLPRRNGRWCCELIKERSGDGRLVVTGVRWAESPRRRTRRMYEACTDRRGKFFLHPIIDWSTPEVWEYIHSQEVKYCSLYDEGFKRLGCVLCPMTSYEQALRDMKRWPKIAEAWRRATIRLYENRKSRGMPSVDRWPDGDAMFRWWLSRKGQPKATAQCVMME